jgi:hypothetical protein
LPSKLDREARSITKSIVIMNEQMANNYKKYGESVFFSVEEKSHINRWFVGAIMGIGRDLELSLFALFLTKTIDSDHLKGVLKIFFGSTEIRPQVIITQASYIYDQTI